MTSDASWVESMPAFYSRCLGPLFFDPYAAHLATLAAEIAPSRVLETAAGTGAVTSALRRALPTAEITATDLNDAMVEFGREQVPDATWLQADAQELPFEDGAFDLVVTQFGVMFFPDKPRAFAEAARVLVPGGATLFTAWDPVSSNTFANDVYEAMTEVFDDPPDWLQRVPYGYNEDERITADARAGGLTVESIDRLVLHTRAATPRDIADGVCRGTPLRFALLERGDLDDVVARLTAVLLQRLGDGPRDGELSALVVVARKSR